MASPAAPSGATETETRHLVDWLSRIGENRDLSLPPPTDRRANAIVSLLDLLACEFSDYQEVVAGTREAARRNAAHLAAIVHSTGKQGDLVRATADAAADAGRGAAVMAQAANALRTFAQAAAAAATDAGSNLESIACALTALGGRLADGDLPLDEMRRSTDGIANFLINLARLSRHAQLLGVNASIEAAHLAEAGSRFGIVAQEVRKLSVSTHESKADVTRIVAELRSSTGQVATAVADSKGATDAAGVEIGGAQRALSQTAVGIADFETIVNQIADVAARQRQSVDAIAESVTAISHHADEAAGASREAAELDLDTLLGRAQAHVGRWVLRGQPAPEPDAVDAFGGWIAALRMGADPTEHTAAEAGEDRPVVAAVRALLEHVSSEQREILGDVVAAAVAVSRNSYAWNSISASLENVSGAIATVRESVHESADGARTSADLAAQMRLVVDKIRAQYDAALELLEGALGRISQITGSVGTIDGFVLSMGAAAARADHILGLIETLSAETDLLSLNAAIEAAHAGDLGLGFGIIAEEIRSLARSTNESTANVSRLVSQISRVSGGLQTSIGSAATGTADVVASAEIVRAAIASLRASFESAIGRARDVSNTASEQTQALDRVLQNVNRSRAAADDNAAGATDVGRLELATLGSRAHSIAARRPLGTVIERVRAFAERTCQRLEESIDAALSGGAISVEQMFDFIYAPIEGSSVGSLGRLFDVSRVPQEGFSPAKYVSPYDAAIDQPMIGILSAAWDEAVAAKLSPVAMFVSDLNGFFYAYPQQKIGPWMNDPAADNVGNRIKRIFEDEYSLTVGRLGLGAQAAEAGRRCTYDVFGSLGCRLERTTLRPWGGYVYARDTSAVCNEVIMALYVRDMRHSTLRICYDPNLI